MHIHLGLLFDDGGATMVEYSIMLAFIAAVCIAIVASLGGTVSNQFSSFNTQVNTAL